MFVAIDEKGVSDPIASESIEARAEGPGDGNDAADFFLAGGSVCAVQLPDQHGERDQQHRQKMKGREGKHAGGSHEERQQTCPEASQIADVACEQGQHGAASWWVLSGGGVGNGRIALNGIGLGDFFCRRGNLTGFGSNIKPLDATGVGFAHFEFKTGVMED